MSDPRALPLLNNTNFTTWRYRVIAILTGRGLESTLEDDPPELTNQEQYKTWCKLDAEARGIITCAMDEANVAQILTCKTSKEIMSSLSKRYEGNVLRRRTEMKNDLARLSLLPEESWQDYMDRAEALLQQVRILGALIEDEEFIIPIIRGLPSRYNDVAAHYDNYHNVGHICSKLQSADFLTKPLGPHSLNHCLQLLNF